MKINIIIIKIIDNKDYMIIHQYKISYSNIFDFNSNLDLIYKNTYNNESNLIFLVNYPNYNNQYQLNEKSYKQIQFYKIQFISNVIFYEYSSESFDIYKIENNKCIKLNSSNLNYLKSSKISIIDLNNNFYCLNDGKTIFLLNKTNLVITKSINIDYDNLGFLKISDNFISVFIFKEQKLILQNYDVSMGGINWSLKESKNLLEGNNIKFTQNNNYIVFYYRFNNKYYSNLFEIKIKKGV